MGGREDNPNFPGIEGIWFRVNDKDGNSVDLSKYSDPSDLDKNGVPLRIIVDDTDSELGWFATDPIKNSGGDKVSEFKFAVVGVGMRTKSFGLYEVLGSSGDPLDDDDIMDYDSLGLTRSEPLTIQEKKDDDDDDGDRDYYPEFPGLEGFWFEVVDINGNNLDLSGAFPTWDKAGPNTDLAWEALTRTYTALQLKKLILRKLSLKISKYDVFNNEDDAVPYEDSSGDVDLDNNGLKKNKPLLFKESKDDEDDESDDSNDSGSDDEPPPPDNPNFTGGAGQNTQDDSNADPYRFFTKRIQCTGSNADWSRYDGAIQNTYQGEILWTDGNLSYGVANMMAYMAVRRVPNTPTGAVVAVGRAANEPAYFVYLG